MSQRSKPGLTDRARRLAGKLRREPVARRLAASPLFDAAFYAAQTGRHFASDLSGARHFVSSQAVGRHSPHPLISLPYVPKEVRAAWRTGGVPALLDWFESAASADCPWGPYFDPSEVPGVRAAITDPARYLHELGADDRLPVHDSLGDITVTWAQARARALDAARAVDSRIAPGPVPTDAGGPTARPGSGVEQVEDSPQREWVEAERGLIDWDAAEAGLERRIAGRVSIVIPVYEDCKMTVGAVRSIAEHTSGHDVEVIVVDNGSRRPLALGLGTAAAAYPGTTVVHLDRNYNFAIGSNYGAAHSSGEYVLFLNNDTRVRAGWLDPLLAHLGDPAVLGVQSLLVFPDETIQCAGVEFLASGYLPCSLLAGHPTEDARAVRDHRLSVVTAAALLMRAADVVALRGFDPIFVNGSEDIDLCLRAAVLRPGRFVVEPDSVVEHRESQTPGRGTHIPENRRVFMQRWRGRLPEPNAEVFARLGLEVAHLRSDGAAHPGALPVVVRPRARVDADGPRLRWSIKNPAPGSWWGHRWGDTRFIASLSGALRGCGQDVVSYRFGTYEAPATALDDVNLVLRGRRRIAPHPGQLNVIWIISHPEDVTREELLGFDLVYAASEGWASRKSEEWGLDVRPLLQAADTSIFQPRTEPSLPAADAGVVFVGQARTTGPGPRQIVTDAVAAGLQPKVWGGYWETHLPEGLIQATSVPYAELPRLYQSAGVVLCDHYPDMAREGFIANRIFDAVACGARVVSDDVAGLEALFGGAVQVYDGPAELARLASAQGLASSFPSAPQLAAIAERVVREHSYEVRAQALVRDVLELSGMRAQR